MIALPPAGRVRILDLPAADVIHAGSRDRPLRLCHWARMRLAATPIVRPRAGCWASSSAEP